MSDQEHEATQATPPKRTPPPPRRGNGNGARSRDDQVAALIRQNQELMARLERVEGGGLRTIESAPESKVLAREADPEELTPFVAEIRAQTRPMPEDFKRDTRTYNWPLKTFAKPDGMVVELQGDPGNVSFYRAKGYLELTADQVRHWLGGEKQKVVAIQREKANLINTLREQLERDNDLKASISKETERAWDHMSVAELEAFLDEVMNIPDRHGKPRRKLRPPQRLIDAETRKALAEIRTSETEGDRLMSGVITTPPPSIIAEFETQQEQAAQSRRRTGRDVEVTAANARQFST